MHPSRSADTAPTLVVISGGTAARPAARSATQAPSDALLATLPPAQRVLWVDADATALDEGEHDLIVLTGGLQRLDDPAATLDALHRAAAPGATLALEVRNHATLELLQRWAEADLTDDDGVLASPHLALGSLGSAYKLLMDAQWMPTLVHARAAAPASPALERAALAFAGALGVPATTARRQWGAASLIVHAVRSFDAVAQAPEAARFSVVVPTTRDRQLRANVECSPGLREVGARIVSVRRAAHPAAALDAAAPHLDADWVLLAHQDVYFPRGFGQRLNTLLATIDANERQRTLIGFAGIGVDAARQGYAPAGFVIDRTTRADWGANDHGVSIDELAIVIARDSVLRPDAALGWHLWATDLCLDAITRHGAFARIVRLPLFHNSVTDHTLPDAFHASAARLAAKYPGFGPIHTLCGVIDERFLARTNDLAA
ncbi:MAG: hypothetical protein U1E89_00740 [Burkholderiaceae bacterium]